MLVRINIFVILISSYAVLGENVMKYNICNGFSNQLLYHAGPIAIAIEKGYNFIEVPNHFIVNGVQDSNADVVPTSSNSVPFNLVFDATLFVQTLKSLGIDVVFKTFDFSKQPNCSGMATVGKANPLLVVKILKAFQPSERIKKLILATQTKLGRPQNGICLHHRDGKDWHDHCARWGSIDDGVYRGNCLGIANYTFIKSLENRGLTSEKWIYYCGDHDIPEELLRYSVHSHKEMLEESDLSSFLPNRIKQKRDLWALIDYFVCQKIDIFIGNSVSTFSALQILIRNGNDSYWYNSGSIPLAMIIQAYSVPLVYTYTEMSKSSGKYLLQASITSARNWMPNNPIHILYNGNKDEEFHSWLKLQHVTIHDHNPTWRDDIETMRKNGDVASSHLFLHEGNYLGTWQRIDIPLFIHSEYCLLVDSDTIFLRKFTFEDFGLKLTDSVAMSSEFDPQDTEILNGGITFMNVPYMRKTYGNFVEFVVNHKFTAKFDHPSPSDQGAYLAFYGDSVSFLPQRFNFKPYWVAEGPDFDDPYILHFHGAKPHDFLKFMFGSTCDKAIQFLCFRADQFPFLCDGFQAFARNVNRPEYCNSAFSDMAEKQLCTRVLNVLSTDRSGCDGTFSQHLIRRLASSISLKPEFSTEHEEKWRMDNNNIINADTACFSEYLLVGWQILLLFISISCISVPILKIVLTAFFQKKPTPLSKEK